MNIIHHYSPLYSPIKTINQYSPLLTMTKSPDGELSPACDEDEAAWAQPFIVELPDL